MRLRHRRAGRRCRPAGVREQQTDLRTSPAERGRRQRGEGAGRPSCFETATPTKCGLHAVIITTHMASPTSGFACSGPRSSPPRARATPATWASFGVTDVVLEYRFSSPRRAAGPRHVEKRDEVPRDARDGRGQPRRTAPRSAPTMSASPQPGYSAAVRGGSSRSAATGICRHHGRRRGRELRHDRRGNTADEIDEARIDHEPLMMSSWALSHASAPAAGSRMPGTPAMRRGWGRANCGYARTEAEFHPERTYRTERESSIAYPRPA